MRVVRRWRCGFGGAQLISCSENIDETPSGVLLHSIMAGIAEFYSRNLASEVKKVPEYYRNLNINSDVLAEIHRQVSEHISLTRRLNSKEVARQNRRLARLEDERRKLLKAHYAEAVPLDLRKEEQARLTDETTAAQRIIAACETQFDQIEVNLASALAMIDDCYLTYTLSDDEGGRQLNRAIFEKLS